MIERHVAGATRLRFEDNLGFLRGCNVGLQFATADLVLLMNNDVELAPGAVNAALQRLRSQQRTGAVGGKIVRSHGLLQEAGCTVWNDGSASGYLRDVSPLAPEVNFVRPVDYCSAAFLMVRGELLRDLEGFDDSFAPAYYEDADLCLRIAQAGYERRVRSIDHRVASRIWQRGGNRCRRAPARPEPRDFRGEACSVPARPTAQGPAQPGGVAICPNRGLPAHPVHRRHRPAAHHRIGFRAVERPHSGDGVAGLPGDRVPAQGQSPGHRRRLPGHAGERRSHVRPRHRRPGGFSHRARRLLRLPLGGAHPQPGSDQAFAGYRVSPDNSDADRARYRGDRIVARYRPRGAHRRNARLRRRGGETRPTPLRR